MSRTTSLRTAVGTFLLVLLASAMLVLVTPPGPTEAARGGQIVAQGHSVRIYSCWPAKTSCSHVLKAGESSEHWTSDADGFQVPSGKRADVWYNTKTSGDGWVRGLTPGKYKIDNRQTVIVKIR